MGPAVNVNDPRFGSEAGPICFRHLSSVRYTVANICDQCLGNVKALKGGVEAWKAAGYPVAA
jgi:hypothetical protein